MIVVGAFNPAVDRLIDVEALVSGRVLRASAAQALPGGKGVHVALTIAALGEEVALVAPLGAADQERFASFLGARGVALHPVSIRGEVRTCLAIRDRAGQVTEVLEPGPTLADDERDALRARFEDLAGRAELAVLSGSLPPGLPPDSYGRLVESLRARGVRVIVDASGAALAHAVAARPFAVKPTRDEAAALLGTPVRDVDDARAVAAKLRARGVTVTVISLGADGAVMGWEGRSLHAAAPARPVQNAVGSGDCLVGGLAVAVRRGLPPDEAVRLAVACGTANALVRETGVLRAEDVETLIPEVSVRALDARGEDP
jgi:1-phosphofructokinase family hexose kinase